MKCKKKPQKLISFHINSYSSSNMQVICMSSVTEKFDCDI